MKEIRLLFIIILFILSFYSVKAIPTISNITIQPSEPWLGENVFTSFACYDQNYSIKQVYANVIGPNRTFIILNDSFTEINNTYSHTIDHSNLPNAGTYNITLYCENLNDENKTDSKTFTVDELNSSIENISPSPGYIGDEIEIDVNVKVNDIPLEPPEIVNFTVYFNDQEKPLNSFSYDTDNDWWILRIDAPSSTGTYDVDVVTKYDEVISNSSITTEIKQPLQFDLLNISNSWVMPDDKITLTFKGLFKGSAIDLKKEYLNIKIVSDVCSIQSISQVGNYSYVEILAPNLSPGKHNLNINFSYMDFVKDISEKIEYVLSISGSILDSDDEAVDTELRFENDEIDETFVTESNGSYSGHLPIGVYDLELIFPNSKLFLDDVTIEEFNNPIKFDKTTTEISIQGIDIVDIFVYEIALNYSDVYLEIEYDDSKIFDENNIVVYKCENWNFGKKTCSGDWNLIDPEIDKVMDLVKVNTTTLSAFLIGYKREMNLEFSLDKDEYFLKDTIKITGTVKDNDRSPIQDVEIKMSISDTSITASTKSDNNGKFSLEFQGPESEGTYTVSVTAEKSSLTSVSKSTTIKFVKKESLSLKVPSEIEVKKGENASVEILITNTGKTDLFDLTLSLTGIPEEYYTSFTTQIDQIKVEEEKKIPIAFIIPGNASEGSHTGKFKVTYDDSYQEGEFILTILNEEENETSSNSTAKGFQFPSILPTAYVTLPFEGFDILSLSLFAVFTFSTSFWLKKRNKFNAKLERNHVMNLLLDIKREINREPRRIESVKQEITEND